MRPLIQAPTWDGKIVLAGFLIVGYYMLVLLVVGITPQGDLTPIRAGLVRDAMLTLGPPIGMVFGALFRFTQSDERSAALRSSELRTAIHAPTATPVAPLREAVRQGAEEGSAAGVAAGLGGEVDENGKPTTASGVQVLD